MSHSKVLPIAETAIAAAVAFALSYLTIDIAETFYLEFAVIPIILLSLRRGARWGFVAGLLLSLLFFVSGKVISLPLKTPELQYLDGVIEYFLAPISLGIAGFFKSQKITTSKIIMASLVAALLKYFWHFIAGGIFWASYTPKGWNPWLFSLATQGISGIITAVAAAIILLIIFKSAPQIFKNSR